MNSRMARAVVLCGILVSGALPVAAQDTLFRRGDVNQDGAMDISDAVAVLFHLFLPSAPASCEKAADINDSGLVDISDAVYGLQFLFLGGAAPPAPFNTCGADPTPDALTCVETPCGEPPPLIQLAASCAVSSEAEFAWEITNLQTDAVTLQWRIEDSMQSGTVSVPASGSTVVKTAREPGVNEMVLLHVGEEVVRIAQADVLLSEIMASNIDSLSDEDGDSPDWIEIRHLDGPCSAPTNLEGWYLTDDPLNLMKWQFPSVTLGGGSYLVVFASGKDRATAGSELHTNFKLSGTGEYLAIVAPDGTTIVDEFAPLYPEQLADISYGRAQWTAPLVQTGGDVLYHVPTAGDAGLGTSWTAADFTPNGWKTGTLGLGFSGVQTEGFEVTYIKASVVVDSLATAEEVLADPGKQTGVATETAAVIDYFNTGNRGNFTVDQAFPSIAFTDIDDFIVHVTGTVLIPQAGAWTFGVNSDDGFRMTLSGGSQTSQMSFPDPRGPADTLRIFNVPEAGAYNVDLLYYERGGGAELELFAAQGSHLAFNYDYFHLVGDTASGGLGLVGFGAAIETDVSGDMQGANSSIWARATFDVDDVSLFAGLVLRMQYEDGFVAYLNGERVGSRNAPSTPAWNSHSTVDRPLEDVGLVAEIDLTSRLDLVQEGANVLAIQGLNNTASDEDFLLLPELIALGGGAQLQYMSTPTPGAFNVAGSVDFVRGVEFSVEHGFHDATFGLELTTPTQAAEIRYTLDGSTPTSGHGTVYSGPVSIDETTVIRAAAFRSGYLDSGVTTRTYIFPADVVRQSPQGQTPGPGWPSGSVNGQILDYGMDPDVVNNSRWSGQIEAALVDIPTISLVTDLPNLFGSSTGIYVNARNDGRAWERRTSVELLLPDGSEGFTVDAGLRIRGAFSRSGGNPKHSFRLIFRSEYGAGKLDYPLFGGEGVDRFDKVDLRTSQNYSWAFGGSNQNSMLREVFSRDTQRDMGEPYTRSRYYHLYLNGHYWGLYQTQERADADFAASYLGGKSSEYDAIKNDSSGSRALQATDGNMDAYRRLYDAAVAGFSSDAAYLGIQGLRPDGSPDPSGERLLDPENLMDYMISTYYTGDPDAPVSCWAHFSNNVFAIYNRVRSEGFTWYRHDGEHSLGANGGLYEARILTDPTDRTIGQEWRHFNPAWLHVRLTAHPEYLLEFADRVCQDLTGDGLQASAANIQRWTERANQIDLAIIAESARWGDAKRGSPLTKDDWLGQVNYMVNTYFPQRSQIVIGQMRSVGMFPDAAIVSFNHSTGEVPPGFGLRMSQADGNPGTIYYTLDGSDPRLWGGGVNPDAQIFSDDTTGVALINSGAAWKYKDNGSDQGTAWRGIGFADGSWNEGPAELGYGDGGEATTVDFGPDSDNKYATTYFRRVFQVDDASKLTDLTLRLVRDDGAVVYLNGTEVVRSNMPAGTITYQSWAEGAGVPVGGGDESAFQAYSVDPALLVDGSNVVAVEVHQASGTSSDLSFDLELTGLMAGSSSPAIPLDATTTVKARVLSGSEWGALRHARFWVGIEGLVINEFMASNHETLQDPDEPGEFPDWIELYNGTSAAIDLGGMYLSDDLQDLTKWRIAPGVSIGPGQYRVFLADDDGTQGVYHTNYQLSVSGEPIILVDTDGMTVIDRIIFEKQIDDVSYGRYPDGADAWGYLQAATPEGANRPHRP